MMRCRREHPRAWLAAATLLLPLIGCGGTSSVSVGVPNSNGPPITGRVLLPNGQLAQAPSAPQRLAAAFVARVEALVNSSVSAAGGVGVRLVRIGPNDIVNGQIIHDQRAVVYQTGTAGDGAYTVKMPTGTDPDTCRFLLEVGTASDRTLTRAFVYGGNVDIDYQSEATVRLILDQIKAGEVSLCEFDAGDIRLIHDAVVASEREVFGDGIAAVNSAAAGAAAGDPGVQAALAEALGEPTPPPPATETPVNPTATVPQPTATGPRPTATVPPTRTRTVSGATRTATATRPSTRTATPEATNTTAPTNTVPAPTNTVPASTNTPAATSTATTVPTNTTAPASATPTGTDTPVPTATQAATGTATQEPPQVNLGMVDGTAGMTVEVPVTLVTNGAAIAAVSNDIEFDPTRLEVVNGASGPDCTVDSRLAASKSVFASVTTVAGGRKRLRVGLVGPTNNTVISSGPLYVCRFALAINASGVQTLLNVPEAASPQAETVAALGSNGSIDVTAASATLGLSDGTAAPGGSVDITATLNGRGQSLAAAATDIRFDPDAVTVADANQDDVPDCTLAAGVAALGKELVAAQLAPGGDGNAVLRVGVVGPANNTPLPDSGALFTCRFVVQSANGTIPLLQVAEGASPAAEPVVLQAEPGSITVVP